MRYLLLLLAFSVAGFAQDMPEAPSHSFFDHGNDVRLAFIAGLIASDGITTQHILNADHGREMNPLVRPLVIHGASGQAGASILGYGFSLGGAYLFHRTGHHRLERLMLNSTIAIEAECVASNLIQIGKAGH